LPDADWTNMAQAHWDGIETTQEIRQRRESACARFMQCAASKAVCSQRALGPE
jgi:hypothetical protein